MDAVIFWSHEVESAIPIAYSAWWNHQEDVGLIPTGDELSICDYEKIWLFHEETFSYRNWYICNTQLVYIFDLKMLTHEMSMMIQWFSEVMKLKVPFP